MTDAPDKEWWTAADLAAAKLPDIPTTKRNVNALAAREGWANAPGKTRRRRGAGGGIEYHWTLLPVRARLQLSAQTEADDTAPKKDRTEAWSEFEACSPKARATAQDRLAALHAVCDLEAALPTRSQAVAAVSADRGIAERSIWNWLDRVEGVAPSDWLPYLVDQRGARQKRTKAAPSPEFCDLVKSDFLRLSQPSFKSCYDRAVRVARSDGLSIPPLHQVRRWYKANTSQPVEVYFRKGGEALRRFYPHQTRDKTAMVPLECIQGDYHRFDVFVRWPGEAAPVRVQGVFFSDVYSGKMLAWRLDVTANSHTVLLALGDLIEDHGIPKGALLDNGREFAAKVVTGGAPTRFRFKIDDEDIPGLLPMLGVDVHWATPYSGQSKPIERAFRDFCDRIAKHPAFEGAYTGNRPDAKPENYGNRAIPLEDFAAIVAEEVEDHNARPDRRSEVAFGRSFNDVFNEGYKTAPIRRATEAQRRLWLLRAQGLRADKTNGELKLHGSRYWSEWMYRIAGQKIAARFDPDDLHAGLHVYDLEGTYLGHAACLEKGAFLGVKDARTHSRRRSQYIKATKAAARAQKEYTDAEIAARLRAAGQDVDADLPQADILRLVTPHAKAPKPSDPAGSGAAPGPARVTHLSDRHAPDPGDDPDARFDRALELEAMRDVGQPLTEEQSAFLNHYTQSAEYRSRMKLRTAYADD